MELNAARIVWARTHGCMSAWQVLAMAKRIDGCDIPIGMLIHMYLLTCTFSHYDTNKENNTHLLHYMYFTADAFATVFAISDLHGDVDATIVLFCDVLRVVQWDHRNENSWRWVAPVPTCVVVCGDIVDRSRGNGRGGPAFGENVRQNALPDDLFLLHMLNHWSDLATVAGSALIRIIGNHEVFDYDGYASDHGKHLLYDRVERHRKANGDVHLNHRLSFRTPGAAYWNAIWSKGAVALWLQIGEWLFVHAGLTPHAVRALHPHNTAFQTLRIWASGTEKGIDRLPRGIADALQTRTMDAGNPCAGQLARGLLRQWSNISIHPPATKLVVGHSIQTPGPHAAVFVHARRVDHPHRSTGLLSEWSFSVDTWNQECIG